MSGKHLTDILLEKLCRSRGLDLSAYRKNIISRHIRLRIEKLGLPQEEYPDYLDNNPCETDRLIDAVLVNVSYFFRDPLCFETIAHYLLPQIIEKKKRNRNREIRVWSAGCAAGEEAYSLAILIREALRYETKPWYPLVFATDISKDALAGASVGRYRRECFRQTRMGILDKYFRHDHDMYEISSDIQKMVRFSYDDLTSDARFAPSDSVFGNFDLILCRNVLIYFSLELQQKVMRKLCTTLARGGFLVLGSSESLHREAGLAAIDSLNRIYRKEEI